MMGTSASMARLTAEPIAADELSTLRRADETVLRNSTLPSAASKGALRSAALISVTASLMRSIAGLERQPEAPARNRGVKAQACRAVALLIRHGRSAFRGDQRQIGRSAASRVDDPVQQAV